jgi:hypothetical protein
VQVVKDFLLPAFAGYRHAMHRKNLYSSMNVQKLIVVVKRAYFANGKK